MCDVPCAACVLRRQAVLAVFELSKRVARCLFVNHCFKYNISLCGKFDEQPGAAWSTVFVQDDALAVPQARGGSACCCSSHGWMLTIATDLVVAHGCGGGLDGAELQ